jgi:protoporphyrinogen oxidase
MSDLPIVIIGAGPCGIGAAWTLHNEFPNRRFRLIDASPTPGGNAASAVTPEGFTFDYGGHVLFPHKAYPKFAELLERWVGDWSRSCPVRGVYMHGRLIAAPVQRNVHLLPPGEFIPIALELLRKRLTGRRKNDRLQAQWAVSQTLETYLHETFGGELSRRVMHPLNNKMWATDPSELSSVWVHQRSGSEGRNVAEVRVGRLLRHAVTRAADPGWDATTLVSYPARGGIGSIWEAALRDVGHENVAFGKRVVALETGRRVLVFDDGEALTYSSLVSTMPLTTLLETCVDREDLRDLAKGLRWSSATLLGFGIDGSIPREYAGVHSFLCPEPRYPFWRVTIPSNISSGNVPDGGRHYSVLCEISSRSSFPLIVDRALRDAVRGGLANVGLIAASARIASRFEKTLAHGYPVPAVGRDDALREIHRRLEPLGILSRGRFGGWRYEVSNQDHAFAQGMEAVRHLLLGEPETTYAHPDTVNTGT